MFFFDIFDEILIEHDFFATNFRVYSKFVYFPEALIFKVEDRDVHRGISHDSRFFGFSMMTRREKHVSSHRAG